MEHYSKCIAGKVLELFKKRGTVANHGEMRFRFRKPSLYPAELRDRSAAGGRGRLKTPYQSAVVIASPPHHPNMIALGLNPGRLQLAADVSRLSQDRKSARLVPYKNPVPG